MSARGLLSRVQRLERQRTPAPSPFVREYGSFEALAEQCDRDIDSGKLDPSDFPIVLECLARWEREGLYGLWRRDRVWEMGKR